MVAEHHVAASGRDIHFEVRQSAGGWDVETLLGSRVVHVEHHHDWHRVERALSRLERERGHDNDVADVAVLADLSTPPPVSAGG